MAVQIPNSNLPDSETSDQQGYKGAFALLTSIFFMWGFITVVNDPLISAFKKMFDLKAFHASLVQFAFFGAFFVVSLLYYIISTTSGKDPINRIGYKNGLSYSLAICGIGCFSFWPAAEANSYPLFLMALFILAAGVTLLQICANPYAAIMGSSETASSRLNMAQGFNSLGTTVGPLVATLLIFKVFTNSSEPTADAIAYTYALAGTTFLLMAIIIKMAKMPTYTNTATTDELEGSVLKFPQLKWGIGAIFFYVGGEVAIGSFLMPFMEEVFHFEPTQAGAYLAYYWGGAMIGRLCGAVSLQNKLSNMAKYRLMLMISVAVFVLIYLVTGLQFKEGAFVLEPLAFSEVVFYIGFIILNLIAFILGKSSASKTLSVFSIIVILLLLIGVFAGTSNLALWALLSIGLFNSIMWSNIFTLAIKDLGGYTSQGSSLLVMAIVGGAFIPMLLGYMIDSIGMQNAFLIPIICYLYILFYGLKGHQTKEEKV